METVSDAQQNWTVTNTLQRVLYSVRGVDFLIMSQHFCCVITVSVCQSLCFRCLSQFSSFLPQFPTLSRPHPMLSVPLGFKWIAQFI
jgi:hypothetical protein